MLATALSLLFSKSSKARGVGLSRDSAFHSSFPKTWLPILPSLGSEAHVQYCIWLDVWSCSHGPGRFLLDRKGCYLSRQEENSQTSHSPEKLWGGKSMHSLTLKRKKRGRVIFLCIPERASHARSIPHATLFHPLFEGLVYQALSSPSFFLCTLNLSLSTMVLPSLQGICPHFLGSPDILAGEISWTCSLFPYRNFLFPCSKRFPWKCSCNQSFHSQSNTFLFW